MASEPRPKIPRDLFIIDEAVRDEYYYIEEADACFYIWERMSRLWPDGGHPDYSQYPVNEKSAGCGLKYHRWSGHLSDRKRIESQLPHWKILHVARHESELMYQRDGGNRGIGDGDRSALAAIISL